MHCLTRPHTKLWLGNSAGLLSRLDARARDPVAGASVCRGVAVCRRVQEMISGPPGRSPATSPVGSTVGVTGSGSACSPGQWRSVRPLQARRCSLPGKRKKRRPEVPGAFDTVFRGSDGYASAAGSMYASIGGQAQIRFRSPKALFTRPTAGQCLCWRVHDAGNAACWRE
jgi:hypothetical protein